jgi:hypothetical protein
MRRNAASRPDAENPEWTGDARRYDARCHGPAQSGGEASFVYRKAPRVICPTARCRRAAR